MGWERTDRRKRFGTDITSFIPIAGLLVAVGQKYQFVLAIQSHEHSSVVSEKRINGFRAEITKYE